MNLTEKNTKRRPGTRRSGQLSELVPDGKVVGIDASAGMIAAAQSRSKPNLTFVQMDMKDMDFQNEFDVIFSNAALHWVKDHGRLLKNLLMCDKEVIEV